MSRSRAQVGFVFDPITLKTKIRGHETISFPSLESKKTKEGRFKKFGGHGITANWKDRIFILTDRYLYYFKTDKDKQPKGLLDLAQYTTIEVTDEKKKKLCCKIYSTSMANLRTFYIIFNNQQEMEDWISCIQSTIKSSYNSKLKDSFLSSSAFVRTVRTLQVRVAEARNLCAKDHGGSSDPYCVLQLGSQNCRTQTIWKNLSPFWGEDFVLTVEDPQHESLVVSVIDEDTAAYNKDDPIGKITFPLKNFADQESKEQWWHLIPQNYENFVCGDVKLRIQYSPMSKSAEGKLIVTVVEARNLAVKDANGFSDPYVKLYFGKSKKKTEIMKKTLNPVYNQSFEFVINDPEEKELIVKVYDWDMLSSNEFMGQISIPLEDLPPFRLYESWWMLGDSMTEDSDDEQSQEEGETKAEKKEKKKGKQLGEIRMKIKYTEERVLPAEEYKELLDLLQENEMLVINALGEVTAERESVAKALVRIFQSNGKAIQLLNNLTSNEVDSTPSPDVIFRGNSLATKATDYFMKLIGIDYLQKTLGPIVKQVHDNQKSCELDSLRLEKSETIEKNFERLMEYVNSFFDNIVVSLEHCPVEFRELFHHLQMKCRTKYGDDHVTRYTAVSGFIFLRFWGPAILGPKLFGLLKDHPDKVTSRTLTLVAKIIQNLGNLVEFGNKEPYMKDMNPFITNNMNRMKEYIDKLSSIPDPKPKNVETDIIDVNKELATIAAHLLKEKSKLLEHKDASTPQMKKLFGVLDTLSGSLQKYPSS